MFQCYMALIRISNIYCSQLGAIAVNAELKHMTEFWGIYEISKQLTYLCH